MNTHMLVEMIGYIGSLLVVISMLMTSVLKLRIINTVGCCVFATYAFIIQSFPTAFMNLVLVVINIYNMAKLLKRDDRYYHLVKASSKDVYLEYFLKYYNEDIKKYFPDFQFEKEKTDIAYYVCCGENPVGILLGNRTENNGLEISLEYTTPMYRDCSVGRYLYGKLSEESIKQLVYRNCPKAHTSYLNKMGYKQEENCHIKNL